MLELFPRSNKSIGYYTIWERTDVRGSIHIVNILATLEIIYISVAEILAPIS
jgi:hypothetical protein